MLALTPTLELFRQLLSPAFCESLEYYTQSVDKESPPELEELNYMTEVGDVFGKILSRVAKLPGKQ